MLYPFHCKCGKTEQIISLKALNKTKRCFSCARAKTIEDVRKRRKRLKENI